MIVLDTNVVSEMIKAEPHPAVLAWVDSQPIEALRLTSVTLAELLFGINAMPTGKRQSALRHVVERAVLLFEHALLPFDGAAARRYAELAVLARNSGRGFPLPDGYIAAIASVNGFSVASRDTAPYEAAGVPVINPWGFLSSGVSVDM